MKKQKSEMAEEDTTPYKILILFGLGVIIMIGVAIGHQYYRSQRFPVLRFEDSLDYLVSTYETNRGALYVTFHNSSRHQVTTVHRGARLSEVIAIGDLMIKKANSDTIILRRNDKELVYVLDR